MSWRGPYRLELASFGLFWRWSDPRSPYKLTLASLEVFTRRYQSCAPVQIHFGFVREFSRGGRNAQPVQIHFGFVWQFDRVVMSGNSYQACRWLRSSDFDSRWPVAAPARNTSSRTTDKGQLTTASKARSPTTKTIPHDNLGNGHGIVASFPVFLQTVIGTIDSMIRLRGIVVTV